MSLRGSISNCFYFYLLCSFSAFLVVLRRRSPVRWSRCHRQFTHTLHLPARPTPQLFPRFPRPRGFIHRGRTHLAPVSDHHPPFHILLIHPTPSCPPAPPTPLISWLIGGTRRVNELGLFGLLDVDHDAMLGAAFTELNPSSRHFG